VISRSISDYSYYESVFQYYHSIGIQYLYYELKNKKNVVISALFQKLPLSLYIYLIKK